jgi:Big-like domain-containing protein
VRLVRHIGLLAAAAALAGCASPGAPPGGPEDREAPVLVSVSPDTNRTGVKPGALELRFDEVINERPRGAQSLDEMFLISPRDGTPRVSWHRSRLSVQPRRGWRANTTYVVTMLPGISDLRNNADSAPRTFVFSTGPTLATGQISGIVFDWVAAKTAPGAFIEAISLPDSVRYVTVADTGARFTVGHMPPGKYLLRATVDQNKNRELDPRELFDSATVTLADSVRREMLAFTHDTIGPGIATVTVRDSLTLRVQFDRPLDTAFVVTPARFTLKGTDSAAVRITGALSAPAVDSIEADSVRRKAVQDSIARLASADSARRADSVQAARQGQLVQRQPARAPAARPVADTTKRAPPAKPSVRSPFNEVVLRLAAPLRASSTYRLQADSIRSLLHHARTSSRQFTTPKPAPVDTTRTRGDSARTRTDTVRVPGRGAPPPRRPDTLDLLFGRR